MMDRRALFFVVAAALCIALVVPAPDDLRRVPEGLAVVYLLLAAVSLLDHLARTRPAAHDEDRERDITRTGR